LKKSKPDGSRRKPSFGDISSGDSFSTGESLEPSGEEGNTNASVLLGLLNEVGSPRKYLLSYAISEPAVTYQEFEGDFGLKGEKLRKRFSRAFIDACLRSSG